MPACTHCLFNSNNYKSQNKIQRKKIIKIITNYTQKLYALITRCSNNISDILLDNTTNTSVYSTNNSLNHNIRIDANYNCQILTSTHRHTFQSINRQGITLSIINHNC